MKRIVPILLLALLSFVPAVGATNATAPAYDVTAASASQAFASGKTYSYALTANLTASSFTGAQIGSTIKVILTAANGTATFTFPSAKRFGEADAASTVITPTAGNHVFLFWYVGTTWYFSDTVTAASPTFTTIELGAAATDTTLARVSAGLASIESNSIVTDNRIDTRAELVAITTDLGKAVTRFTRATPYTTASTLVLTAAQCSGGIVYMDAAQIVDLPTGADGLNVIIKCCTTARVITINPGNSDYIELTTGAVQADGVSIVATCTAGQYVALVCDADGNWSIVGYTATIAAGT